MKLRLGASERSTLIAQGNLATTYRMLGRDEEALSLKRDVYSGRTKLHGEENERTLRAAYNYATSLHDLRRLDEAKSVLDMMMPVARRVLGEDDPVGISMRECYATVVFESVGATPDDLREAMNTFEELERTARRVLGGAHPSTVRIESNLRRARADLRAREALPTKCDDD